jgi:hypothetical protein
MVNILPAAAALGVLVPAAAGGTAATDFLAPGQRGIDHGGGAAHPARDADGARRAIELAGATFHAGAVIDDLRLASVHGKHSVGADHGAQGAAGAFFNVQNEGVFGV